MNEVERLAEALRQANAGLDIDPVELTDVVANAHGRLIRRLLFVATLSALATALLLSGSLAASDVIKGNQDKPGKEDGSKTSSNGQGNGHGGNHEHHDRANGDDGHHDDRKEGGGDGGGDKKERDRSQKSKGGGTEAPGEELPDLVVLEVTESEVVIEDRSDFAAEPFFVLVTVPGTEFEERLPLEEGLAAREPIPVPFEESPECLPGSEIVAFVDDGKSVTELDESNNTGSGKCEAPENGEATTTSKEEASANAATAGPASESTP